MKTVIFLVLVATVGIWLTAEDNRERAWEWIEPHFPEPKPSGAQIAVRSYDGACQLTIDDSWTETKRGYSFDKMLLDMQVALKWGRASVIVLAEPIENATYYDLSKFSEYASNFTRSQMEDATIFNGPINVVIGGLKGHQYVFKGRMENRNVVILHTSLQGKNAFYQIAAITTEARLEKEKKSLLQVVRSFQETPKANNLIRPRIIQR